MRMRAVVIDTAITAAVVAAVVIISSFVDGVPQSGRVLVAIILGQLLLYEPLLVSRYGATLGHRSANLRVVADSTNGNPGFLQAFGRYVLKATLGVFSFIAMLLTSRHQAVHDVLSRTTVQVRDLSTAEDYLVERSESFATSPTMPSAWRRLGIILAYEVVAYFASGFLVLLVDPSDCAAGGPCTSSARAVVEVVGLLSIVLFLTIIVLGWRGLLWGARRAAAPVTETSVV